MTNEKAAELNQGIRKLIEQLASETDAARQSELFSSYLRTCGLFHNYSWGNQMLIWSRCPQATRVAGFQTWKKMGRFVKAGEKGIPIFAPMIFSRKEKGSDEEKSTLWFKVVYVFDVAQTDGEALPQLPTTCTGEPLELTERLVEFAAAHGITVETKTITSSGAKGYAHQKGTSIVLDSSLTAADRAAVLVHEISHCLLHFGEQKPDQKTRELEAEATSFVVSSHFGLNPQASFYLASYGVKAADLMAALETVQKTAAAIISGCEKEQRKQAQAVAEMACAMAA